MIYISVVQFIKFRVKIVQMYMLVKRADVLILALSEHKRDLKPINLAKLKEDDLNKKTALVKHCFNCEHRIDFGNFEILDYNIDYDKRKFLESLYINNFALSNYEIVMYVRFSPCVCWFVFLTSWFLNTVRVVLLLPEEVRPMQRTKRR